MRRILVEERRRAVVRAAGSRIHRRFAPVSPETRSALVPITLVGGSGPGGDGMGMNQKRLGSRPQWGDAETLRQAVLEVNHLVATYGYWAVALLIGAESLGIPLPGETILIVAATYAGHTHKLSVWLIFLFAAAAAIIGDNIGFLIGQTGGYALLRRYGRYIRVEEDKLKVGRYLFDRRGGAVVFFGRFVSVLRTYAAFLAGTNRMQWRRFLAFNAAGGLIWAGLYTFAAYKVGDSLQKASGTINLILGAVAVVAIVAGIVVIRRQTSRLSILAEAAYPGPLE